MNQKNNRFELIFKEHTANFMALGPERKIKILDFKKPDSNEFRVRFLFEEDYYTLHISGDLGSLTASNHSNMTYEKFGRDFADNIGYFREKIDSHERPLFYYDEEEAKKDVIEHFKEYELYDSMIEEMGREMPSYEYEGDTPTEQEIVDYFLSSVLYEFDDERGLGEEALDILRDYDSDIWEVIDSFGKKDTDILEIYMTAFKLAKAQIDADEAKKLGWIPVTEKLPEEHYCDNDYVEPSPWVLVHTRWGTIHTSRYWGHRQSKEERPNDCGDWMDLSHNRITSDVTHWMPLPEAPALKCDFDDEDI